MKTNVLIIFIFPLLLSGCIEDNNLRTVHVSGKIVSKISGKGIAEATLISRVNTYGGSGILSYSKEVSSQLITTDEQGNFSATLYYEDSGNVFLFDKEDDEYSTHLLTSKKNFYLSELEENDPLIFKVREYKELEIKVKSIASYDENDAIGVSIYEKNASYIRGVIYKIKNFEDINEPWGSPAFEDGNNPYWVGDNVNSIIFGRLQEGTAYVIIWSVRKNNIIVEHRSEPKNTISDELNTFDIEY